MGDGAVRSIRALPRFFVAGVPDPASETVPIPDDEYKKLHGVLRLPRGSAIAILPGDGRVLVGTFEGHEMAVQSTHTPATDATRPVTLALGLAKPEKIEESIRMATEIGVSAVRLFASDRSVTRWDEGKRDAKLVRLRRIAQEAAEVCFRTRLPEICFAKDLAQVLQDPTAVVLSETEGLSQLFTPPAGPVTLVIGPEGGWSPREVALIGDRAVTLGPRVFRVDTAVAVACGLALHGV